MIFQYFFITVTCFVIPGELHLTLASGKHHPVEFIVNSIQFYDLWKKMFGKNISKLILQYCITWLLSTNNVEIKLFRKSIYSSLFPLLHLSSDGRITWNNTQIFLFCFIGIFSFPIKKLSRVLLCCKGHMWHEPEWHRTMSNKNSSHYIHIKVY